MAGDRHSVLIIGGGAREHAMAVAIKQSPRVETLYGSPGNAGMASLATLVDLPLLNFAAVDAFVREKHIDLIVIGPEAPLVHGLADALRANGHRVVGASQAAAQLEGSKIFAKTFMAKYGIPTADFKVFDNAAEAQRFVRSEEGRAFRVLKADGLAAGKGVVVAHSADELLEAIDDVMGKKKFGSAGDRILLEETLTGPEVSLIALTDGRTLLPFPASQDHKRVFDDDKGPNTGGMGAYAPTPFYDDSVRLVAEKEIVQNFLHGLKAEGLDFRGIIYFGLMLTPKGPQVLEFNVRFGDPEAEVILPLVQSDLYTVFTAVAEGKLADVRLDLKPASACTVVMASGGYPGDFTTGAVIEGLDQAHRPDNVLVFHAGTKKVGGQFVTNGGRVLAVTGVGKTLKSAVVRAYQGVKKINFARAHFRRDIAFKALQNKALVQRIHRMKSRRPPQNALA